ncbi:MAG: tRNA glutamyl-Q(34) synthetase GluQRS [Oscillospiraceae bacterium]
MAGGIAVGRLAPSPSGRMHLGNVFSALLAYLSVKSRGGKLVLRIEDLDRLRCKEEYAETLMDDLAWLGIGWDEGPFWQSRREEHYRAALTALEGKGLLYPCYCTRRERLGDAPNETSAPHGPLPVYGETCRNLTPAERSELEAAGRSPAVRLALPDRAVSFVDGHLGGYTVNLRRDCGDPILRRADGFYAYQLAVSVDDGEMGVTEVVRGSDLCSATPVQIFLQKTLGYTPPTYYHVPLLTAPDGRRLSKRDGDLGMEVLRRRFAPEELLGHLAAMSGLAKTSEPIELSALTDSFTWESVTKKAAIVPDSFGVSNLSLGDTARVPR